LKKREADQASSIDLRVPVRSFANDVDKKSKSHRGNANLRVRFVTGEEIPPQLKNSLHHPVLPVRKRYKCESVMDEDEPEKKSKIESVGFSTIVVRNNTNG
jgi:hypothetical protein